MQTPRNEVKFSFVENSPPVFTIGNLTLEIEVGKSYASLVTLAATDSEGDTIAYLLTNTTLSGLSVANDTGVVTWDNVPDVADAEIIFSASDGKGQAALVPNIELCKCKVRLFLRLSLICFRLLCPGFSSLQFALSSFKHFLFYKFVSALLFR